MMQEPTKAEYLAWDAQWKLVNEHEAEELRNTPIEVKWQQLAALMASVDDMGWREALEDPEGVAHTRAMWKKLREAHGF